MLALKELAAWLNKTYPDRNWDQWCARLMWNAVYRALGYTRDSQMVTYRTARLAREASRIESSDPAKAPAGAMHWWRNPISEGHVGMSLGGNTVLMTGTPEALGRDGRQLGTNYGVTTVEAYSAARSNPYLGWSRTYGKNPTIIGKIKTEGETAVSPRSILAEGGLTNVDAILSAAERAGLPLHIGAAMIEKESGGRNIFGHDSGGAFYGAGEVTEKKFKDFLKLVRSGHVSNGVGPAQITWAGFFDDAEKLGLRLWVPEDNIYYGFRLLAGYLGGDYSDESIRKAGVRYNGSPSYGRSLVTVASAWKDRLARATGTAPKPPANRFVLAPGGEPSAPHWPEGPLMARIQRALKARGRYGGPADGIGGPETAKGIQRTLNISEQNGRGSAYIRTPVDGKLGINNAFGVQYYARKFGDYTGPLDGDPRRYSWEGFALGLERP